jgi:hypothetical protein
MTLSSRNTVLKAGIGTALAAAIAIGLCAVTVLPVYPALAEGALRRAVDFPPGRFLEAAAYAPFAAMLSAVVYALVTAICIYYFFEKTQSPEILFFALFALSLAFEAVRIMTPLKLVYDLPGVFLIIAQRVLLFGRHFGILSLFAASLYAVGLRSQKEGVILFSSMVVALVIALRLPVDGLSWDSSFSMISGFQAMFRTLDVMFVLITAVDFFVSAWARGSREYAAAGFGALAVFLGRNALIYADSWAVPLPGIALIVAGTWVFCSRMHRVYLWG